MTGTPEPIPAGAWERDEQAVAWVYGSILTSAAVVAAVSLERESTGLVFAYTATTMLVVWLAHSFSLFVGHGGRVDLPGRAARAAHALKGEVSVLLSAIPTLVALAACWVAGATVDTSGWVALAVSIAVMVGVAGAAARRTGAPPAAIVLTAGTALLLGGLIVAAKVALK